MSLAPVISSTGIVAPTFSDILTYLEGVMTGIYGSDLYLQPDSQDGQFLAALAQLIKDNNDAIISAYNSFSPATAQGTGLSVLVKINGLMRLNPSNSTTVVRCTGTVGTPINYGQAGDALNQVWLLPPLITIPIAGYIDVTATAQLEGAIQAASGSVNKILTPTRGWQSVVSLTDADPGAPVESDATLRSRQAVSTSIPALSVLDAILGAIRNVAGVVRAIIYENDSGAVDGNGLPAHSISAVVQGGDIQNIGDTIALYKTPGTGTFGTTSVTTVDEMGISNVINFFELDLVTVSYLINLKALTGFVSSTETYIVETLIQWTGALAIGESNYLNRLWAPVNLSGDAATTATGQSQTALDAFSATYNALSIYQASDVMLTQSGPFAAGSVVIQVLTPAAYKVMNKIAVTLDDATILYTGILGIVGVSLTMADPIPAGRSVIAGALVYVADDISLKFNQAAITAANNINVEVS